MKSYWKKSYGNPKVRYRELQKALLSLQKGLRVLKDTQQEDDHEEYLMVRDGLIQRFEYS